MRHTDERGAAGVLVTVGMCLALTVMFGMAAVFIAWFSAVRQAEQAAELSALAAASASVQGADPCRAAEVVARLNGVDVASCEVRGVGRHVVVEVSVEAPVKPRVAGAPSTFRRSATAGTGAQ